MVAPSPLASFVARIWLEAGTNGDPKWRGRIRHVQSGRQDCFEYLSEMSAFVERESGLPGPSLGTARGWAKGAAAKAKRRVDAPVATKDKERTT